MCRHTDCTSAPFCAPFTTATALLPPRFASDFARLTNWLVPKASAAGRFSRDIVSEFDRGSCVRCVGLCKCPRGGCESFCKLSWGSHACQAISAPPPTAVRARSSASLDHHTITCTVLDLERLQTAPILVHFVINLDSQNPLRIPREHGFINKGGAPGRGVSTKESSACVTPC